MQTFCLDCKKHGNNICPKKYLWELKKLKHCTDWMAFIRKCHYFIKKCLKVGRTLLFLVFNKLSLTKHSD